MIVEVVGSSWDLLIDSVQVIKTKGVRKYLKLEYSSWYILQVASSNAFEEEEDKLCLIFTLHDIDTFSFFYGGTINNLLRNKTLTIEIQPITETEP